MAEPMDLILNLTPTGMIPTKAMTPHVPVSVSEIVEDVHRCAEIGITMVHLHARDDQERPTHKADVYGRIVEGIRRHSPELVLCVSLSGRTVQELALRAEPLCLEGPLKPDMGSLTLSSMNFPGQASLNPPDVVRGLAEEMLRRRIVPELEIFDLGMANYAKYLLSKGLLEPPLYANVFLGNIAGAQLDLAHAGLMLRDLPSGTLWSMAGLGDVQLPANLLGIAMGGGVRVGLEDAIHMDASRRILATNAALVERIHALASRAGRKVMSPGELRRRLSMNPGSGEVGR